MTKNKGQLIVIDGIDGSGKATQTKLLGARLKKAGYKVATIDFPRYYDNFFGRMLGEYLSGQYGDFSQIDPPIASLLYAADRFESSQKIKDWLAKGYLVVADRYVSANQIHQGGKISNLEERKKFMQWLGEMEYGIFDLPRAGLTVFLDVPYEVSVEWLKQKIAQRSKKYLKGRKDVAEENLRYLKDSRASALWLVKQDKRWRRIECCKNNVCLAPEQVHERVFELVRSFID